MISSLELARLCGVAQATVDRAIHNRPGIAPKTRQRILREAAKHGYRANPVASELLRGDSRVVGAVAPLFGRVFFNDLLAAIAVELATRDQRLFVAPVEDEAGFFDAVHEFAARRVRAMVVIPPGSGLTLTRKQAGGAPVASLISPCGDYPKFISPDEQQTGVDAVEYLMRRGHRRIVHVTFARSAYAVEQRTAGYARAMQQHDCTPVVLRQADEAAILRTLREHRPTAWFCHNDWLAVRLLSVLHAAGVVTPAQASVLGVDDSPTLREVWPTLTTMRYPMQHIAREVATVLSPPPPPPEAPPEAPPEVGKAEAGAGELPGLPGVPGVPGGRLEIVERATVADVTAGD